MKKKSKSKLIKELDKILAIRIRNRDEGKPCIDLCGKKGRHQAGHFRSRRHMNTRFHPQNINGQNEYCNSWDNDGYNHGKGIDKRWGEGTAQLLDNLSRKGRNWSINELMWLIKAVEMGYEEYETVYFELSPKQGLT